MTMHQDNLPPLQDPAFQEMMDLFKEKNYWQRLQQIVNGIGKPKDSREYKIAQTELQRQAAPLLAIALPAICVAMLAIFANAKVGQERVIETEIMDVQEIEDLQEIIDREVLPDDIQPQDIVFTPDIAMSTPAPSPTTDGPMSPQPAAFDAVMQVRSPVILRNIFGSTRSAGTRGQLITSGGGNAATETAVMRALRWLKTKQQPDGSWPRNKSAMTALAILCYLAHGEKPGSSEEFGDNVQRGIEYLLKSQPSNGQWRGNYEHYIVTYALSEAYGMTMNPNVKSAVDRAVKLIIDGQHVTGGWDYGLKPGDRDDTSVMGWAAQALKAAMMADFYSDPEALLRASKLS
ncbi:MAG: terpene cyclase/mutase family protein, partial [Lentisphaerae bacterium]|nr:terpene cyclase/mutase family protein [Lentisphaerota bacterium]